VIWRALLVPAAVAFAACSSAVAADTVNSIRQAHGLKPLQQSGAMQTMAQRCASSMAARNSLDHAGFFSERAPAGARAENVAFGCATQSCTIGVWSRSAGHRANMLNRAVRSYGLASAAGGGRLYWCMELGFQAPHPPAPPTTLAESRRLSRSPHRQA